MTSRVWVTRCVGARCVGDEVCHFECVIWFCIISDSRNRSIRVNDSFRTIERADPGRSRLEVIEFSAAHPAMSDIEVKSFIDETYESGKAAVTRLREEGQLNDQIISIADFEGVETL